MIFREWLRPFLRGHGAEIGPGGNPLAPDALQIDIIDHFNGAPYPLDYRCAASPLPMLADDGLDYLCNSNVIEHLPNPLGALREWLRAVRPGGFIVLVIPDKRLWPPDRQQPESDIQAVISSQADENDNDNPGMHRWFWTPASFLPIVSVLVGARLHTVIQAPGCCIDEIQREVTEFDGTYRTQERMQMILRRHGALETGQNFIIILEKAR